MVIFMALIIAYVGKKGCIMVSDKRSITYFGNNENLSLLEDDFYSGKISTKEELFAKADELNIGIKITDKTTRIDTIGEAIKGEISTKGAFETKRRRVYGTTNGYQIVELVGSKIISSKGGEKAIIVFGNKFAKSQAEKLISQKWKSSLSLKYMGDIFKEVIAEVSKVTPSVGNQCDVLIKQPDFSDLVAREYLIDIIEKDVKLLDKYKTIFETEDKTANQKDINSRILENGMVGYILSIDENMVEVKLNNQTQAFDKNGKCLAAAGEKVIMFSNSKNPQIGDEVIMENGNLYLKKDSSTLNCNIVLCRVDR